MKHLLILLLTLMVGAIPIAADTEAAKVTLKGRVTDQNDGQPVMGVSIYLPLLKQGTAKTLFI